MSFNTMLKTHSGIESYRLPYEKIGPLENDCIKQFDKRIADLVCLFLDEECTSEGIDTIAKLYECERKRNSANGESLNGYTATIEDGAQLSTEQIKSIFHYIWKDYRFFESTGADFATMQFILRLKEIEDPIELLFWSFRLCAWGEYANVLPYTLYRCIVDERFKRFDNSYPEWHDIFLCINDCEGTSQK